MPSGAAGSKLRRAGRPEQDSNLSEAGCRAVPQVRSCEGRDAPSRIRTCGLLLRRESLYPAELSGPAASLGRIGSPSWQAGRSAPLKMLAELLPLALVAALYPPILAMVVVILARPSPRNLLLAYVLGALLVSIAAGLAIVAALNAGNVVGGSDRTVNPAVDIATGLVAYFVAWILLTDRDRQLRERRARRKAEKADGRDPWSRRALERDSVRLTFLLGVVLNTPGASYLVALKDIAAANQSTTTQVIEIVAFNLIMFVLAEVPLVGYTLRPERTREVLNAANDWLGGHSRQIVMALCLAVGTFLLARGIAHAT